MKKFVRNQLGQATLIMVLVVMSAVLLIIAAVGFLTYNDIKQIGGVVASAKSYYVAESGVEDVLLRIIKNMDYSNSYSLSVGEGSADVNVSGPLTALTITSRGDVDNRIRKLQVDLGTSQTASNISFNYGVQVGYGGLHMDNNSTITGNVYSNGPITAGPSNPDITGSVYAASGGTAMIDQANDTPTTPPSSITFGDSGSTQDGAQSFQVSTTNAVSRVELYLRKQNNPGNLTVRIVNDNSGNPGSTTFASGNLDASSVTGSFGWVTVNFSSNPQLNSGVTYWLVIDGGNNSSRYYFWGANNTYASGVAKTGPFSSGPWNTTSLDGYFKLYLGGAVGTINGIDIGTSGVGDGHANTITGSTATGTLFCQTGSGNDQTCNTSQADPAAENMPVSDANITQWKADAAGGGTISGDYTPAGTASSLGPVEITGNLTIPIDYDLNITGTVYVHGYIQVAGGAQVTLDPAYGTDGGLILADGYVNIGNNVSFSGSGQAGSYMIVLTINDCNGTGSPTGQTCTTNNSALYVQNNAQNVVLYAANGQLRLNQGANTKEATAYRLYLEENVIVSYEGGLANSNFTSGPGGGYQINSWREIE